MRRALDLFCGAGGASKGLADAGFKVTGLDSKCQPNYPFEFFAGDVFDLQIETIRKYDFVWASPPCQFATAYKRRKDHVKPSPEFVHRTRSLLLEAGVPFVIENVDQKLAREALINPVRLCGSMFGLDVQRHRLFEAHGFKIHPKECDHSIWTPRFPPATNRKNLRKTVEVGVWRVPLGVQQKAMGGCEWMTRTELSQAIPPAYSRYIAECFLEDKPF